VKTGFRAFKLLGGPPESVLMRSGAVFLKPGQTVGKHNTEDNEELLIVLEGEGSLILSENRQQEMQVDTVQYIPPDTEHNVINTGSSILRYIYVTAKTK
jgi:mannose-6-phosphate isomerase-like protein (cupin superfamily)